MADLDELIERVALCRTEISALTKDVQAFRDASLTTQTLGTPQHYDIFVTLKQDVPVRLRQKAGTIANELRSCLDGLAVQLAKRNGATDEQVSKTYFPISRSAANFNSDGRKKIKFLSAPDQQKIIGLNPYDGANNLLFGVHEADRIRKHQRLGLFAGNTDLIVARTRVPSNFLIADCIFGGHVIEKFMAEQDPQTQFVTKAGESVRIASGKGTPPPVTRLFNVVYQEPDTLKGRPIIETLSAFCDTVENIIRMF